MYVYTRVAHGYICTLRVTVSVFSTMHVTCVLTVTVFYNIHLPLHSGREEEPLKFLDEQHSVPDVGNEYVSNEKAQVPSYIYVIHYYSHVNNIELFVCTYPGSRHCVCVCVCVCK